MSITFPKSFLGPNINQQHWNYLTNILTEDINTPNTSTATSSTSIDKNNFDCEKLFKLYENVSLCKWIPRGLLLINTFRYFNNKPLILIKIKDLGKIKDQLDYYSLVMDNDHINKSPLLWETINIRDKPREFCLINDCQKLVVAKPPKKTVSIDILFILMEGFVLKIGNISEVFKIKDLGDSIQNVTYPNEIKPLTNEYIELLFASSDSYTTEFVGPTRTKTRKLNPKKT